MVFYNGFNFLKNLQIGESVYRNQFHLGARLTPVELTIYDNDYEIIELDIPQDWIHSTINVDEIMPFMHNNRWAIIPVNLMGALLTHQQAINNARWNLLDTISRGDGGEHPQPTLIERMTRRGGLRRQLPLREENDHDNRKVLYSATGVRLKACRCHTGYIIRDKLCYLTCGIPDEAAYLVAILNAPLLGEVFNILRNNERYIGLHPLAWFPIPEFDPNDRLHLRLTHLAEIAENFVLGREERNDEDIDGLNIEEERIYTLINEAIIQLFAI